MADNDFTLDVLKRQFGLRTEERRDRFSQSPLADISGWLRETLGQNLPLALAIATEKARSELIIMPVLLEAYRQTGQGFSLFSGVEFNVDFDQGLRGVCDFLLSLSPEQLFVEAPVVAVVEARNDNIKPASARVPPRCRPRRRLMSTGATPFRRSLAWSRRGAPGASSTSPAICFP